MLSLDKCPVDVEWVKQKVADINSFFDLPWSPVYTQSGASSLEASPDQMLAYWGLAGTIAFIVTVYALEGNLDARQKEAYLKTTFPKQLEKIVSEIDTQPRKKKERKEDEKQQANGGGGGEQQQQQQQESKALLPQLQAKFKNAQAYGLDKINFGMISSTYDTFESVVFLLLGFMPYFWDKSVQWGQAWFGWSETEHEVRITLIYLGIVVLIGTVTTLPFEVYSTFQIEKKHGFNKQTPMLFVTDKIKTVFLTALIGGPFTVLLLNIIKWGGDNFFIYVWAFMFVFSVFMMTIVPSVIMPMFNKYDPLDEGELKTRIYELADGLKFPLKKLFVVDGSKRSSHSNAYLYGFLNSKRIVLFDTLLDQVEDDEVLAILGHELGHWKLGHTVTNFVVTQLYTFAAFYAFSLCYKNDDLYRAFGFDVEDRPVPTIIALMLFFQTLWAPVDKVLSFLVTANTRRCEFDADKFSVGLGMGKKLQSGLCKIHLENLGAMCSDPWYSTYHYSHPPLVERLSAMMRHDKAKSD